MTLTFSRTRVRCLLLMLPGLIAAALAAGCGKKGPPLAPVVKSPGRVTDFTVRRFGDTVFVQFKVPVAGERETTPVELERVDVYAYTAKDPAVGTDLELTTLIGSVAVKAPVTAEQEEKWAKAGVAPPPNPGVSQGSIVAVTETITPEALVPLVPKGLRAAKPVPAPVETEPVLHPPLAGPIPEPVPMRYYVAQAVGRKDVKGTPSARPAVVLQTPPPPPGPAATAVTATAVQVTWTAPAAQRGPVQEPATGDVLKATPKGVWQRVVYTYNIYATEGTTAIVPSPADPSAAPAFEGDVRKPVPLNPKPLAALTFDDISFEFGKERCYAVRSVETVGAVSTESDPSAPSCVTPVDQFPPPVPASLSAVASEGAISLIWEGVEAADLAGYLVLRSTGGDAPLIPLFDEPIRETTFRDATATPGVRYTYAVVSVDTAAPRNVSAPSIRIEESAR